MVILRIKELQLEEDKQHIATDWQVSDTLNFSNILLESIEDRNSLYTKIFHTNLDPKVQYYGRARALLSTGYTYWGNLDVFNVEDTVDIGRSEDMPTRVGIPIINTFVGVKPCDVLKHDATAFTIVAGGFDVIGNATHKSTSWIIEDIYGNVVWCSLEDELNKESIFVENIILRADKVYRIKVMFHTTSDDASQIATKTIKVAGGSEIEIYTDLDLVYPSRPLDIRVFEVPGATKYTWEILSVLNGSTKVLWHEETTTPYVRLRAYALEPVKNYILRVKTDISNTYLYINILTQDFHSDDPAPTPGTFPITYEGGDVGTIIIPGVNPGPTVAPGDNEGVNPGDIDNRPPEDKDPDHTYEPDPDPNPDEGNDQPGVVEEDPLEQLRDKIKFNEDGTADVENILVKVDKGKIATIDENANIQDAVEKLNDKPTAVLDDPADE